MNGNQKRIGLDLDHTILKRDTKDPGILFGFKAFVMEQREKGRDLFIFCHMEGKNETCEQIEEKMSSQGLFKEINQGGFGFAKGDLVFTDSDGARVEQIKSLSLSHFVDGEPGIFLRDDFPKATQPLVFGGGRRIDLPSFPDWSELTNYFLWEVGLQNQTRFHLKRIRTIKEKGDNFTYQLTTTDGTDYLLKHYFDQAEETRNRLETEVRHLRGLKKAGITQVPTPYWEKGSWAIYEFIEGEPVDTPDNDDLEQAVNMLLALDRQQDVLLEEQLDNAVGARLCFHDYVDSVNRKWQAVMRACQRPDGPKDILLFLMTDMEQMRQDTLNHLYLWCHREGWDKKEAFPKEKLIFSPVDFGLHNTLKKKSGEHVFVDFELSGWDDPAHLIADIFHNPEQNLSIKKKLKLLDTFAKHRKKDKDFMNRFLAVADLVAVEWIFEVLRVVVPEEMRRLQFTIPNLDPKQIIHERFNQAVQMKESFQSMEHLCKTDQLLEEGEEL